MRYRIRNITPDILIGILLFVLPLILFWAQTLGGKTLIPSENLFQFEPYATYREVVGAPEIPHNHLVSDLVLQNFQWKSSIKRERDIAAILRHRRTAIEPIFDLIARLLGTVGKPKPLFKQGLANVRVQPQVYVPVGVRIC